MIKVSIIINSSRKLSAIAQQTLSFAKQSSKLEVIEFKTEYANHAREIAKTEALNADIIIAVGGDGTCNEVVQGLIESGIESPMMAIIPNGTGNDFSRMLPSFDPVKFVKSLEEKQSIKIDLGSCEFNDQTRYFINVADIGFGAKVIQIMDKQRRINIKGKVSYALAILRGFFAYQKTSVRITGDNFQFEGKMLMIAFCNGHTFGHGLRINPDARLDNGKVCVTVIGNVSLITYVRKLGALKKGRKITHPEVHYFDSKSIEINGLDHREWMEGDGELFDTGLKRVSILPGKIQLIS